MAFSNSPLVQFTKISPNKTTSNRKPIDRITIHHAAGNILVESMGEMFSRAAQRSSSNYGVGTNGKIAMYVEEAHSSWCSSSTANDTRAVTIEVANSSNNDPNWPVSDAALNATIKLCADICKRNGKNKLVYLGTLAATNSYNQKSNEMVLTRHDWFKNKVCLPVDTTEVLTRNGWKKLDEVQLDEEIASVTDLLDMTISFQPILDIVEPYKADVYSIRDVEATGNHRMVFATQYNANAGIWEMKTMEEIINHHRSSDFFPQAGFYRGNGLGLTDDEIELIIASRADGHYMYDGRTEHNRNADPEDRIYYGIEYHLKKPRKINRIKYLLDKTGFEYKVNAKVDGSVSIRCYDKELMKLCESYLNHKKFTWELLELNHYEALVFLDSLLLWDGSAENHSYFSNDKINRDIVVALAALHGRGALFDNSDESSRNTRISVSMGNYRRSLSNSQASMRSNVEVSCVSVNSGVILIRQNRRTTIVGNCPGPYLGGKFPYIVQEVNKLLGSSGTTVSGTITSGEPSSTGTGITSAIKANMNYAKLTDKSGQIINVPDGLGTVNTYMHWQKIKSDSLQKDLRTAAGMKFDSNGYGKIDDRYVVAMTTTFGQVGDMVDICREGSAPLKAIIGDIKDQTTTHGDPANKWGHSDGKSIVEFIVDANTVKSQTHINETDPGKNKGAVLHVENRGNWFLKHQNDPAPSTTTTTTSSGKFPYLVRVTDPSLNIRKGPGTNYPVIGTITDKGVYTIVAESTGTGANLWGQLKPVMGSGWISLGFTKKV